MTAISMRSPWRSRMSSIRGHPGWVVTDAVWPPSRSARAPSWASTTDILTELRRAALLHDIGKLLVPIAFLEKPAELTDAERRVVDEHARAGAAVLGRSRAFARLAPLTVAHHERLDGNGMFPAVSDERSRWPPASWPSPTAMRR